MKIPGGMWEADPDSNIWKLWLSLSILYPARLTNLQERVYYGLRSYECQKCTMTINIEIHTNCASTDSNETIWM